ncbi:HK97 family phage prohead protease [Mesorhizobium sp. VK4C]|uniref:HK97 family phage prohead protease n=1 Tax=Mesorhizobium captivum TaxID=3072319 RepID=UPI002A23F037|nr:HK97 family phage prohead protease [Mesorhizobium sp. VK4C]MDX8497055.1 HK97 family phage prohead protease [Mesorhizobium sp. VK4C]
MQAGLRPTREACGEGTPANRSWGGWACGFSADLDSSNPDAALALSSIGRRDTVGMSFGFRPTKENWLEPEGYNALPERTILEAALFEISAVIWPAYRNRSFAQIPLAPPCAGPRQR